MKRMKDGSNETPPGVTQTRKLGHALDCQGRCLHMGLVKCNDESCSGKSLSGYPTVSQVEMRSCN